MPAHTCDRELLELAAKAAGIVGEYSEQIGEDWGRRPGKTGLRVNGRCWNPLEDDGDALRLAVKLGISITPYPIYDSAARHSVIAKQRRRSDTLRESNPTEVIELYGEDPESATRRAIVRAAAALGEWHDATKDAQPTEAGF